MEEKDAFGRGYGGRKCFLFAGKCRCSTAGCGNDFWSAGSAGESKAEENQPQTPVVSGPKILVKKFHITGQDIYHEDVLSGLCSSYVGKEVSLGELNLAAAKVTAYFRAHGYLVATAWLPAQTVKDGIVEIQVVVGRYGDIKLRNQSSLQDSMLKNILSGLKKGEIIRKGELDAALLSLSDTSGIVAKATLKPGKAVGTSDLLVDVTNSRKVTGYVYADNWGNRYTGHNRSGVNTSINNVSGAGDKAGIGGLYSGKGMWEYDLSYQRPLDGPGTKLGISYSQMRYALGNEFQNLNASGLSRTTSLWLSKVLQRSRMSNLNAILTYSNRRLDDRIAYAGTDSRKKIDSLVAGLNGDWRDLLGGGGVNSFSFSYTTGVLAAENADSLSTTSEAGTRGRYQKGNLLLSRLQAVNDRVNLWLLFNGQ